MTTSLAQQAVEGTPLDAAIAAARRALLERQNPDGHWVFELEADATIPSEYIVLGHITGEIDRARERRICAYLRRTQRSDGGWGLYYEADTDVSATTKAYLALKLAGDSPDAPHMRRARERILERGGAARCNVFTRIALALFGLMPWRAVPAMPVEVLLLPEWSPFHLNKISYWSRTVVTPLLVLIALRPKPLNPGKVDIRELYVNAPETEEYMRAASDAPLGLAFLRVDSLLRTFEPAIPRFVRAQAIAKAMKWTIDRLNGEDGLGAIFPAMVNALLALDAMGYKRDHPLRVTARKAIDKLVVDDGKTEAYCQPCVSPIWDTSLTVHGLLEDGTPETIEAAARANDWLAGRQVTKVVGDWATQRPNVPPGGWAFQYWNDYYPDVDDTAVVAMGMHRGDPARHDPGLALAAEWVVGMQSSNGGWGAFDAENEHYHLNHIPFADHGALLDPPTEDVSARCVGMLLQMGYAKDDPAVARGLDYLRRTQQNDGSWFGRWGTNYIYGTWSVLNAFMAAGETASNSIVVRRAVDYLLRFQRADGGWGEDGATYWTERRGLSKASTASQTAWACLGLMNAGAASHPAVARGIAWLRDHQNSEGLWDEPWYTAVGFPRVFYLRYHGYRAFFPYFALARFRNLVENGGELAPLGF